MLTLTDDARELVRRIPHQPMHPLTAGLRISRRPTGDRRLNVKAEDKPREGDEVLDYDGARVFLGPQAAATVRDKCLDATRDESGRIQFLLTRGAAPTDR